MNVLLNATGSTEYRNVKVQSRAAKLLYIVESDTNAFDVILSNLLLSITRVGKDGESLMLNRQSAIVPAETWQYSEGYILVEDLGGGTTRVSFTIDLANEGALPFDNDVYMSLDLEGLLAADTVSVYSIDVNETDLNYNMIDNIMITGATKDISLAGAFGIVLPSGNTGVDRIQIDYASSEGKPAKSCNYSMQELRAIARDTNDVVYAGSLVRYGYNAFIRLDIKDAVNLQIVTNTNTPFYCYVLREKAF
jgi:hypothetical protein